MESRSARQQVLLLYKLPCRGKLASRLRRKSQPKKKHDIYKADSVTSHHSVSLNAPAKGQFQFIDTLASLQFYKKIVAMKDNCKLFVPQSLNRVQPGSLHSRIDA